MSVITQILERINEDLSDNNAIIPDHKPELLLIGCVDARKDPVSDLGIPKGKALILRNIAALIRGAKVNDVVRETSESAVLEFAVKVMKVKHVAVMGHTHCGGIRASLENIELPSIKKYLSPLDKIKEQAIAEGKDIDEQARILERAAVRFSVENLKTYPYIEEAVAAGRLQLHGWIIDIATGDVQIVD